VLVNFNEVEIVSEVIATRSKYVRSSLEKHAKKNMPNANDLSFSKSISNSRAKQRAIEL
jgi:hypothetical protein